MIDPTENLVRMANQIAANNGHWPTHQECVERVSGHIRKFWAPSMIAKLRQNTQGLSDLARESLDHV